MHIEISGYEYNGELYTIVGEAEWEESHDANPHGDGWSIYCTNVFYENEEGDVVDVFFDIPADEIARMECALAVEHERILQEAEEFYDEDFFNDDEYL